jgi:hypothetical protein
MALSTLASTASLSSEGILVQSGFSTVEGVTRSRRITSRAGVSFLVFPVGCTVLRLVLVVSSCYKDVSNPALCSQLASNCRRVISSATPRNTASAYRMKATPESRTGKYRFSVTGLPRVIQTTISYDGLDDDGMTPWAII